MKLEKKSIKQLKKQAWKLCSEYIRRRDNGCCFTCFVRKEWKEMQAGHFIHGNTKLTWLDETNIHCQCSRCNMYLSGNLRVYTLYMIKKYGIKKVETLEKMGKQNHYHKKPELIAIIKHYQKKLYEMQILPQAVA